MVPIWSLVLVPVLLVPILLLPVLGGPVPSGPVPGGAWPEGLAPRAAEAADMKALDEYFEGKVTALDGKTITLRYDFRKKGQAKDWFNRIPHRIKPRKGQKIKWFDSSLKIIGNAGARHKAEWMGNVLVTATFIPETDKDFGGYLSPVSETEDFATFTFVETFFHAFDKSAGGTNSIIKFGAQWREGDASEDYIGFRYVTRKPPKSKPALGKPIRASFGLQKKKLIFNLPEYELKGTDKGKRLKRFFVGFYAVKGDIRIDNVEITGQLASDWMKREKVELRMAKPIGDGGGTTVDDETKALIAEHQAGKVKATQELLSLLRDESQGAAVHEAVVQAFCTGPKKRIRNVVDLLYDPQEPVRALGITIISNVLGKDYGYNPKGSEKSRGKAIRALNEDLKANPALLKD